MRHLLIGFVVSACLFSGAVIGLPVATAAGISQEVSVEPAVFEDHVLGVLQYRGGFAKDLSVPFAAAIALRGFTVKIPAFCRDVEVIEAGALSDQDSVLVRRSTTNPNTFYVDRTQGLDSLITALKVTVNGPLAAGCDIPVLEVEGSGPVDPIPSNPTDGSFAAVDGTRVLINRGAIVRHNISIGSPNSNQATAVIFSSSLVNNGFDRDTYQARGYADYPVFGPFGPTYCRLNISFDFNYRNINQGEMAMRMSHSGSILLDQFGRCMYGQTTSTVWYMRNTFE